MQELTKVRVKKLCAKVLHVEGMCVKDCEGIVFCVQKLSVEESCVKDMYVEEVFVKGLCAEEIYAEELHANERCTYESVVCDLWPGRATTSHGNRWSATDVRLLASKQPSWTHK